MGDERFRAEHQRVHLTLDVDGERIAGVTDLVCVPRYDPHRIGLNADASQMKIVSVHVDGESASFVHNQTMGFGARNGHMNSSSRSKRRRIEGGGTGSQDSKSSEQFRRERKYFRLDGLRDLKDADARECERAALAERGELIIHVPSSVQQRRQKLRESAKSCDDDINLLKDDADSNALDLALSVRVVFTVSNFQAGVHVVKPRKNAYPNRPIHMFTYSSRGRPSSWFPCNESHESMSTFDLVFDCPRLYTVVAPGVCTAAGIPIESGPQSKFRRWGFEISKRVQTRGIGFAVGPFGEVLSIEAETEGILPPVEVYVPWEAKHIQLGRLKRKNLLARAKQRVQQTCGCLAKILETYIQYLDPIHYPFKSYKQVFVHEACSPVEAYAGMTICHIDTLHDSDAIDQVYESRRRLAKAVAAGWLRHVSWIKGFKDEWMTDGFIGLLVDRYIRETLGNNESSFLRREAALKAIDAEDPTFVKNQRSKPHTPADGGGGGGRGWAESSVMTTHPKLPLAFDGFLHMGEITSVSSREHKATITMLALENMIGKSFQRVIFDWLEKRVNVNVASKPGETNKFISLCKKATSRPEQSGEIKVYAEQFIDNTHFPRVHAKYGFNRKERQTTIEVVQDLRSATEVSSGIRMPPLGAPRRPSPQRRSNASPRRNTPGIRHVSPGISIRSPGRNRPGTPAREVGGGITRIGSKGMIFEGRLTVKVKELNHQFVRTIKFKGKQMHRVFEKYECRSQKPRNQKRKKVEESSMPLDDLLKRRIENPICWVRLDPEQYWVRPITVSQDEVMWIYQLRNETDVLAQLDAITGIRQLGSKVDPLLSPKALEDVVTNRKYYFKVRIAAAEALAALASHARVRRAAGGGDDNGDWKARALDAPTVAYNSLIDFLKIKYYDSGNEIWRQNNFSDLSEHFLQRGVVQALSKIKDNEALSPTHVVKIVVGLLANNDNSRNPFSDSHYLADIIRCLGAIRLSKTESSESIWEQLERYLRYDRVLPSYRNLVSCACLQAACDLRINGVLPPSKIDFVPYSSYPNYDDVRCVAYECLVRLIRLDKASAAALWGKILHDPAPGVRRRAARYWAERWEKQPRFLRHFRIDENALEIRELRTAIWDTINDHPDEVLRYTARRLYKAIWSRKWSERKSMDRQVYHEMAFTEMNFT
ncbi:hypothetical protein AAMO2058_000418600 [Amorphochlora amoebiformis]